MQIISRHDAIKLNLLHYFTGNPCRAGHTTQRRVKDRQCLECGKIRKRQFRKDNKESIRNYEKNRWINNKLARNTSRNKYRHTLRLRIMEFLGGAFCANCGCNVVDLLEVNHKNGGGRKTRKYLFSTTEWNKIIKGILKKEDYNVLCKVCNTLHYVTDIIGVQGHFVKWEP